MMVLQKFCHRKGLRTLVFTARYLAACSAVYCNRSCLWVCLFVCGSGCLRICYLDNSKLRASILAKLGL